MNIRDGLFTVVLGDETPLSNDALATTRRYLGITIDPDPEMLPRQRIHPVPWALRATQADKATSATSATSANTLRPNAAIEASSRDGIKIKSAKSSGISVINASTGFYVDTATNNGVKVKNATNSGVLVENSTWGFYAIKAGPAFQTENGKGWGMYVRNAGTGVAVEKTTGGYAGWFGGTVYVKGNCQNCRTAIIGRNATSAPLEPGAIVTINGISSSDLLEHPVVEVAPAFGATSILGVVEGRAAPQETTDGKNVVTYIVPQEGAAQPGEYVNIVTYGMAQVKVSQVGDLIRPGTRVTTSDEAGRARLLNAELPESSSNASVVGMALESSEAKDGLIWVLVNPR
ncbi:hypothetical protein KFU94_30575 [Chloroflexi bacterium TSY]|nr:hypothetical protein [Chloroflexi bacterium TSY]